MPLPSRLVMILVLGCLAFHPSGAARGQEGPTRPTVSSATLQAVKDQVVILRMQDGTEVTCRVLQVAGERVVVARLPGNDVVELPIMAVFSVRLLSAGVPLAVAPVGREEEALARARTPGKPRHLALNLGVAPALNIDVDVGLFHGFLNGSLVFPIATQGQWLAFSAGLGIGIPVSPRQPNLKLDIFAMVAPMRLDKDTWVGIGVGLGLHYTWNNGLTLGFTVPILGYAVHAGGSQYTSSGDGAAYFYLAGATGLPLGFIGYRF